MTTRYATGYEAVAIEMGRHISNYVPTGFCENIAVFDFVPSIIPSVDEECHEAHEWGFLKERLKKPFDYQGWDRKFKSYVQEAILDFFENDLHLKDLEC